MNHFEFFNNLRADRGLMFQGSAKIISEAEVADILPRHWREERVSTPAEWFIRTGRGLGLDIRPREDSKDFVVLALPLSLVR